MEIKGIEFKIPNEYDKYLGKILEKVNDNNYIWKIEEDEIYLEQNENNNNENLFQNNRYSNVEFQERIFSQKYYMIFANIKMYLEEDNIEINIYEDFIKSKCILILLVTDNEFVEVYSKDQDILDIIYKNAITNKFKDVMYISNNNYKRKELSAYSD